MSGENTPKSEIGKISYQNWKSEPKNSPKAFGELIMFIKEQDIFWYYYIISRIKVIEVYVKQGPPVVFEETKYTSKNIHENKF